MDTEPIKYARRDLAMIGVFSSFFDLDRFIAAKVCPDSSWSDKLNLYRRKYSKINSQIQENNQKL